MDLDTGKELPINAFLSILPLSIDFSASLLPATCLLLGIYFSPLHTTRKHLNAALASGVRKLGPTFLILKLGEFLLFDGFLDLADFLPFKFPDLDDFRPCDNFYDFLASSSSLLPTSNLLSSPLLFLSSSSDTSSDPIVFSIEVSKAAILLKS